MSRKWIISTIGITVLLIHLCFLYLCTIDLFQTIPYQHIALMHHGFSLRILETGIVLGTSFCGVWISLRILQQIHINRRLDTTADARSKIIRLLLVDLFFLLITLVTLVISVFNFFSNALRGVG